jgi:hypothetical protein
LKKRCPLEKLQNTSYKSQKKMRPSGWFNACGEILATDEHGKSRTIIEVFGDGAPECQNVYRDPEGPKIKGK